MKVKTITLIFIISIIACSELKAQPFDSLFFRTSEKSLMHYYSIALTSQGKEKLHAENIFRDSLLSIIHKPGSFFYSFDSLAKVGKILSDDNKLRIYSWNFPEKSGFSNYYCILQYYAKKEKMYFVYSLKEDPGFLKKYPQATEDTTNWLGALYYTIIDKKYKGQTYYTLLGFNFNDILSNIKIIDVLAFDEVNKPYFPQKIFLFQEKTQNRIIFEYAERAQMMLDYNINMDMIVCDHLSPAKPSMEHQYQFYGPDFSYDGFFFEDGIWQHKTDITIKD